jgi:hypothetical protein
MSRDIVTTQQQPAHALAGHINHRGKPSAAGPFTKER